MHLVDKWLQYSRDKMARIRSLEDALLTGHFFSYSFYRLRYFFGISAIEAILHIVEFTILAFIFSQQALVSALVLLSSSSLFSAFYWGFLENMREQIRNLRQEGKTHLILPVASQWISYSVVLSTCLLVFAILWVLIDINRPLHTFTVLHLFVLAIAFQLSTGIIMRTYHSVIYAIRRVYRPFWALLLLQLGTFAGTVIAWPIMGMWGFPAMLFPTTILATFLTWYYVSRSYQMLGLKMPSLTVQQNSFRIIVLLLKWKLILPGLAYASLRLDNILVILVFANALYSPHDYNLFIFLYLISPFVHACYEWSQLFYFDLVRLDLEALATLRGRFVSFVQRISWSIGAVFALMAGFAGTFLVMKNLGLVYFLLLAFFLLRSRVAFSQIECFAEKKYYMLVVSSALLVLIILSSQLVISDQVVRFVFYVLALMMVLMFLMLVSKTVLKRHSRHFLLALPDWLLATTAADGQIKLRSIVVDNNADESSVRTLAKKILRQCADCCRMSIIGNNRIIWAEMKENKRLSDENVISFGAGRIDRIQSTSICLDGEQALLDAKNKGMLGRFVAEQVDNTSSSYNLDDIKRDFASMFPGSICYDARISQSNISIIPSSERREIMYKALQYARNTFKRSCGIMYETTALILAGQIHTIFAVPVSTDESSRRKWHRLINRINIAIACGQKLLHSETGNMNNDRYRKTSVWAGIVLLVVVLWNIPLSDTATGGFTVKPVIKTEARAPARSFLASVQVQHGQSVTEKQLVARLQLPELESELIRKQAEISEISAELRKLGVANESAASTGKANELLAELNFAKKNYFRAKKLYENQSLDERQFRDNEKQYLVWQSQYDQVLAEQDAQRARLLRAEEELKYLQSLKTRLDLYSTQPGVIITRDLHDNIGKYYEEGELVFEVVDTSKMEAEISVSESDMLNIKPGQPVDLKIFALPYETLGAKVIRLATAVETDLLYQQNQSAQKKSSTNFIVICELLPHKFQLAPGMTGYAKITIDERAAGSVLMTRLMRFIRTEFWW